MAYDGNRLVLNDLELQQQFPNVVDYPTLPAALPTKPFSIDHMLGPSFVSGGQQVFEQQGSRRCRPSAPSFPKMLPSTSASAFLDHSAVVASANLISITRFSCGGSIFPQPECPPWWGAAAPALLGLRGVVHVVGGPDVLHGRVLAALLRPEERVLQHPARAAGQAAGCAACANSRRDTIAPATSSTVGARAAAPSARPPKYPKAPPPSAATATSPFLQPLLPSPLWPVLCHALRRQSRPIICGGAAGQYVRAHLAPYRTRSV